MLTVLYFFWTGFTDSTQADDTAPGEVFTAQPRGTVFAAPKRGTVFSANPRGTVFEAKDR